MRIRIAIVLLACGLETGISAPDEAALEVLVAQLDDDAFAVRQQAMVELLKLGESAVPMLEGLDENVSPEQRAGLQESWARSIGGGSSVASARSVNLQTASLMSSRG